MIALAFETLTFVVGVVLASAVVVSLFVDL